MRERGWYRVGERGEGMYAMPSFICSGTSRRSSIPHSQSVRPSPPGAYMSARLEIACAYSEAYETYMHTVHTERDRRAGD